MPGEKKEDIEDARKFLKELYGTWFRIYAAVPLEGSDMYKEAVAKGYAFMDRDAKIPKF